MNIPVIGISYALGEELYTSEARVTLEVETLIENMDTFNIIAETAGGRDDRIVVVGAHLDSVPQAPGINDNGSGSATILEIALQMAELGIEPRNKVRFAWWGAEEYGLEGSEYYLSQLTEEDMKNIALNLNFDMVGSTNYVRFVYDGDGSHSDIAGPNGSGSIEDVFLRYFAEQDLATAPTELGGYSDYAPFLAAGIPVGGLFTGAWGIKTDEEAATFGGFTGEPYDPCIHTSCDTIENIDGMVLDEMGDAAAHAVMTFALTVSDVTGTEKGSAKALKEAAKMEFWGPELRK